MTIKNNNRQTIPANLNPLASDLAKPSQVPRIYCLVVAAGRGSRFGGDIPKQYTQVLGKTILEQSIHALSQSRHIKDTFLVIAQDDKYAKHLSYDINVKFVPGGEERWQSVQAGVTAVLNSGANADDLILIHDAARPCVLAENIDKVLETAAHQPYGAILGIPVTDTLKKVSSDNDIEITVDRRGLWQAQTPQVFRAGKLHEVLHQIADEAVMITDEASAFEYYGYPIKMVAGSNLNLKLTYANDLFLIETILKHRHQL